jgi:elongation factor 1-gamma
MENQTDVKIDNVKPKKSKAKSKVVKENDEEEDLPDPVMEEPKKADPFASLVKSAMNLGTCKTEYHNKRAEGIKYFSEEFWSVFDSEGYSIHFGSYKYNDELGSVEFVRRNKVNGLIRELDSPLAHKNMFGVIKILGESDRSLVALFVTRGKTILPELFDSADYFEWTTLTHENENDRIKVCDAFHSDGGDVFDEKVVEYSALYV